MAFVHGKNTFVSLDSNDLSEFTNNTENTDEFDSHDVTTYGKNRHVFVGGLGNGTITISGIYDSTGGGPRDVIKPLLGTVVEFIVRPEGTGEDLPEDTVDVLVMSYQETSPVADMVTWQAQLQMSDTLSTTDQNGA